VVIEVKKQSNTWNYIKHCTEYRRQQNNFDFEVNPYNWCVVKKTIKGLECTFIQHVDDQKFAHVDAEVVIDTIKKLKFANEKEVRLPMLQRKVLQYLGLALMFSDQGKINVAMNRIDVL
jgi:hypothetical protein